MSISRIQVARRVTLGISLVGVTVLAFLHQRLSGIPSIDALDPFGGLETIMKFAAGGEIMKKIEPGTIVLFGAIVALGLLLSRFFCGWFCAFGALQGVFGWLGRRIFRRRQGRRQRRRLEVPRRLDSILRWLKYPLLLAVVFFTWRAGELVIRPYDPMAAYGHLSAGLAAVWAEFAVGLVILVLVMLLSMLYERVFCKYLCPLGAFNALLGRVPSFRIGREKSSCISCSKCDGACPMNIEVSRAERIDSPECIACMECVTACPTKKGTLSTRFLGRARRPAAIVALGLAVYVAAALVGQGLGMLRFSPKSLQERASVGALKVEDIKGSSTYAAVAQSFGIEPERLYRELGIDQKKVPLETMLKDTGKLAGIPGFEADAVRLAVAKIIGAPYAGEKGQAAAQPAAVSSAPAAEPQKPAPVAVNPASRPAAPGSAPLVVPADFALEGSMSVLDLAAALGAKPEAVIAKLALPADIPRDKPLRDLKDEYGFSMPELKARIKE